MLPVPPSERPRPADRLPAFPQERRRRRVVRVVEAVPGADVAGGREKSRLRNQSCVGYGEE
ncbi:hypothetical protein [Streptomyces venezuelae]|uniref:hypothetical protein n=1 Tax=Streptomyces venezuelae TaxID=54571 RepID=UPI0016803B1A|nr:hypothetical protein [Streptomyces venezuelae]